jgi:hypothetical protein
LDATKERAPEITTKGALKTKAYKRAPFQAQQLQAEDAKISHKVLSEKVRTHEDRLLEVETSLMNFEKTIKRNKQLAKKVQELEDQLEKQSARMARLLKTTRNTERSLRENGLLRDNQRLSDTSDSELE